MFAQYSKKDGLVHDFVTCIVQDEKGFIWLGTEMGSPGSMVILYENRFNMTILMLSFKDYLSILI